MFCEEYGDMAPVEVMRRGIREPGNVAKHVGDKGTLGKIRRHDAYIHSFRDDGGHGGKRTGGWGRTT